MNNKTITMSLEDYENLITENKVLKCAAGNSIAVEFSRVTMDMGCSTNRWIMLTKDEVISELTNECKRLKDQKTCLFSEINDLNRELKMHKERKSWLNRLFC